MAETLNLADLTAEQVTELFENVSSLDLTDIQKQLGLAQVIAIADAAGLQRSIFETLGPQLQAEFTRAEEARDKAAAQGTTIGQLQGLQMDILQRGGAVSPEQEALISESIAGAQAAGVSDIERFETQALTRLREELAPSLGLRPSDAPILDRGAIIAEEALRQKGQLSSTLQAAGAQQRLNLPTLQAQVFGQLGQGQQSIQQAAQQFQQQLAQQAFANRLQLTGQAGNFGLGLATGISPNLAGTQQAIRSFPPFQTTQGPSFTETLLGIGTAAGGLGGLLSGLTGAGFFGS